MLGLMGNKPNIDVHDHLLPGERCGGLSYCIILGLCSLGERVSGHVVPYDGALLELVPDGVGMIWACRLEELFKVISRLPPLALEVALSGSDIGGVT
jgi:hypothetical protein